jgi:hypothetical protein
MDVLTITTVAYFLLIEVWSGQGLLLVEEERKRGAG